MLSATPMKPSHTLLCTKQRGVCYAKDSTSNPPMASYEPSASFMATGIIGMVCEESCQRMQLVADMLLLKEEPQGSSSSKPRVSSVIEPIAAGHESYSKASESIVANTKGLSISVKNLEKQVKTKNSVNIGKNAEKIASQAILLTEAAAQAAYFSSLTDVQCKPAEPGAIDRYMFERARQAIQLSYNKFQMEHYMSLTDEHVLSLSKAFADNLAVLTQGCDLASKDKEVTSTNRLQLAACSQCLQGATASFIPCLKLFGSNRSQEARKKCLLFGKPLLAAVDAIVDFAAFPQFSGTPAKLTQRGRESQTNILGGAMAIVSSCIQLLSTVKVVLTEEDQKVLATSLQKFVNCVKAVGEASKLLSTAVRHHTPASSRRPSIK